MNDYRYARIFGLGVTCLLVVVSLVLAQESGKPPIKLGGVIGVNYVYGSYDEPHPRGTDIGRAELELFRLNADLNYQNVIGRVEYRWYNDSSNYSMFHTAWLGVGLGDSGTLKAGVVRVPFGPTAYGVSSSWFFDQHFYVGLADDMDLGISWQGASGRLTLDVGYYPSSEFRGKGSSLESARYAYDVVRTGDEVEIGFEEQHQFNFRAIYTLESGTELGGSLQYGLLQGTNIDGDDSGEHHALSGHMKNDFGGFTLYSQLTYYVYDITDATPWGTGDLIYMGAYNYADLVASEGIIPAVSLRYNGFDTSGASWLDSVTPYVEWSSILKQADGFNDSQLVTVGAAWTIGALYMYSDVAISDGNYFVGFDSAGGDFGSNEDDSWNWRLNFNFRYYF